MSPREGSAGEGRDLAPGSTWLWHTLLPDRAEVSSRAGPATAGLIAGLRPGDLLRALGGLGSDEPVPLAAPPVLDLAGLLALAGRSRRQQALTRLMGELPAVLPLPMWVADAAGRCLLANQELLDWTGREPRDLLDHGWLDHVHPDDRAACRAAFLTAREGRARSASCEVRVRRADGAWRSLRVGLVPWLEPDGALGGWIGGAVDATESAGRQEPRPGRSGSSGRLLDSLAVGVADVGFDGLLRRANRQLLGLLGRTRAEVVGRPLTELLPGRDPEEVQQVLRRLAAGTTERVVFERRLVREGRSTWLELTATSRRGEGEVAPGVALVVEDVTHRRRTDQERRAAEAALEERVRARTRALATYQQQLRRLASELTLTEQRERRRLAADLHDYLAQLLVVCNMRLERLGPLTSGAAADLVAGAREVLQDALTYTRTLVAELSPSVLHEAGLLPALQWLAEQTRERHGVPVRVAGEEAGQLAEEVALLVYQGVRELLFNAVKHARARQVTITLERAPAGRLVIEVADDGVGFDPRSLPPPGLGGRFGLVSLRERLQAIDGGLQLDAAPGQGSRARISVPGGGGGAGRPGPAPRPGRGAPRPAARNQGGRALRVVLIEDHPLVRVGIRAVLERHPDLTVVGEESDGLRGVELARRLAPDVVVTDVHLPGCSGIEVARRLRESHPATAVLGLSSDDTGPVRTEMQAAGAAGLLRKGCAAEELLRAVRACAAAGPAEEAVF